MKFIIDMNLSPTWEAVLEKAGYGAKHWSVIGSPEAKDAEILEWAKSEGFIVFTHDLDLGPFLPLLTRMLPVLFKYEQKNRPHRLVV